MLKFLKWLVIALVVVPAALWVNWQIAVPSHERNWRADHSRLPQVAEMDGVWTVENLRNWDYTEGGEIGEQRWETARIVPAQLVQAYFIVEPFASNAAVAHTMLSFRFEDGSAYVASVEARREEGETYSAPKAAVWPIFENMVVWTTERDMFGNSEFWADDRLYLHALTIPLEHQRAVLEAMLHKTADIQSEPEWYNTLFSNCTSTLARAVNEVAPDSVPLTKAWVLTGFADDFLMEQGLIGDAGIANQDAFISPLIRRHYGIADPVAFSAALRADLGA